MAEYFRFVRFAIIWLVVFLMGRLILGAFDVAYAQGTHVFSMVTFSWFGALFFGAFSRRARSYKWYQGMLVGGTIAFSAQVLIFLATVVSYLVGADTYFNHPTALNVFEPVPLVQAVGIRAFGLVVNTIIASIIGLIGWSMGNLIPES
ncbi:MAG TPA: hypothetical protein VLK65_29370 [Vicinamibacteria bacterium]|nr:hypothetical protein [Vicinamibacteria bacterium]